LLFPRHSLACAAREGHYNQIFGCVNNKFEDF
jgi:hypothetical protein